MSRRRVASVAVSVTAALLGLTACSTLNKIRTTVHDIRGNRATIDHFTSTLQTGAATPFEATYVTTGSSPATIVYAVQPPRGVAFSDTPSGGTGDTTPVHLIVNSSGEFACTLHSTGRWSCDKLGTVDAATQNKIFDFYTPSHWISFLKDFSLAAGIAGDKVSSSSMEVNGFALHCVDFQATGVPGTSTICSTQQGILGYVKVADDSTSFEIQRYTSSPASSLFQLPAGATVTSAT